MSYGIVHCPWLRCRSEESIRPGTRVLLDLLTEELSATAIVVDAGPLDSSGDQWAYRDREEATSGERAPEMIDQTVTGYSKERSLSQTVGEHALLDMIEESLARLAGQVRRLPFLQFRDQHGAIESSSLDLQLHRLSDKARRTKSLLTFGDLKRGVPKSDLQ